jgi:hypothetical protein
MRFGFVPLAVLAALSFATAVTPLAAEEPTEDEEFTEAVKDFGYAGGAAWQCAEGDSRVDLERQAMVSYNGLARLFGTDDAFFFSAAFGAGTSAAFDKAECESFAKQFQEGLTRAGVE